MNELIERVMKILRRTAPSRIDLSTQFAPDLPAVIADPSQLEQVIMNLSLNAIQATPGPGTIALRTRVETLDEGRLAEMSTEIAPGDYVVFEVQDSGCGMDAETLARIYEPFFTTKFTGRGMGLSATLGIIQSNKGHIDVHSELGRGTTMTVYLPAAEQREPADRSPVERRPMGAPRGTETILVIDDEIAVGKTVEKILAPLGYMVIPQADPKIATEFLEVNADDIDLILLDLNMPEISGPEMFRTIQRHCPEKPVLLVSGYDSPENVDQLQEQGAGQFLQKPFSIMTLATAIRHTLDGTGDRVND
jgi:CheY-like chemotaxis protein